MLFSLLQGLFLQASEDELHSFNVALVPSGLKMDAMVVPMKAVQLTAPENNSSAGFSPIILLYLAFLEASFGTALAHSRDAPLNATPPPRSYSHNGCFFP